jgi:hypothetical protein
MAQGYGGLCRNDRIRTSPSDRNVIANLPHSDGASTCPSRASAVSPVPHMLTDGDITGLYFTDGFVYCLVVMGLEPLLLSA